MDGLTIFLLVSLLLSVLKFAAGRLPKFAPLLVTDDAWFDRQGEKYRILTDDEFVARCRPGTRRETALKVRAIFAEVSGIPEKRIHPEHTFVEDLGVG